MPTRRERNKLQEQQRAQQQQRKNILVGVGVVIGVLVVGALAFSFANASFASPSTLAAPIAAGQCTSVQDFPNQGGQHIATGEAHPSYVSNPPTSGWHWANPQEWGIYDTPQVQEQLVHNLEHGGIVIQYRDLPASDLQQLKNLVQHDRIHIVLAPYPDLPTGANIALTAWTHLQLCNGVDENSIKRFITAFRDKGPETVP